MRCPDCGFELNENGICENCNTMLHSSDATTNKKAAAYDKFEFRTFTVKAEIDKSLNLLKGLISGVQMGADISDDEITRLKRWCTNHAFLEQYTPINELIPLILDSLDDNTLPASFVEDVLWVCDSFQSEKSYYDMVTADIQKLHGILGGILANGEISKTELTNLQDWLYENDHLKYTYPYDELISLITGVLADGIISDDEEKTLKTFFSEFIDVDSTPALNKEEIEEFKKTYSVSGICAVAPEISFDNTTFCFTGASSKTSRKAFVETIKSIGCTYKENPSSKVDYLIIGDEGNPCWAFSCYGRKVEAAVKLRKSGCHILIIHENDFWDAMEDNGLLK